MKLTKEQRAALIERLREAGLLRPTRVIAGSYDSIILEGGTMPAHYNPATQELTVWGRAARWSGGPMTVDELIQTRDVVRSWYTEVVENGSV